VPELDLYGSTICLPDEIKLMILKETQMVYLDQWEKLLDIIKLPGLYTSRATDSDIYEYCNVIDKRAEATNLVGFYDISEIELATYDRFHDLNDLITRSGEYFGSLRWDYLDLFMDYTNYLDWDNNIDCIVLLR